MAYSIGRLHHIQLAAPVGCEDESRKFWGDVLGMSEITKPPALQDKGGCWFRGGSLEVHIGVEQDFQPAKKAHPGILISGLQELAQRLQEHGIETIDDGDFPGFDRFYAADPFGNRLEFLELRSTRAV